MSTAEPRVMTDELWESFSEGVESMADNLFLERHDKLVRHWTVQSTDATFSSKLETLPRFGAVNISDFERFSQDAEAAGYGIVFMEDPKADFDWLASLDENPGVSVESNLDGRIDRNGNALKLVNGFLPFQARGLQFMKSTERMTYFRWSTGTGKTLAAEGTILVKRESGYGEKKDEGFDLCLYVVKPNNLYNSWRKLRDHTGLASRILTGTPKRRERLIAEAAAQMQDGEQPIMIMNAEKFREDTELLKVLVEDHKLLIIIDEAPTKYANRGTALYRATAEVLYKSSIENEKTKKRIYYPHVGDDRPSEAFYVLMSATPIRNSPEDVFNCVRMADSRIFGSVTNFNNQFVAGRDRWHNITGWRQLDLFGAMISHVVHNADKETDPDIAAQFPHKLPAETLFCDMDDHSAKLYQALIDEYDFDAIRNGTSMLDFDEILAAIGVLQMICSNPRSVLISAEKFEAYMQARTAYRIKLDRDGTPKAEIKSLMADFDKKNKDGSEVAHKLVLKIGDKTKFTDVNKKGECVVSKLLQLRELLNQHDDKAVVFTAMNETLLPLISDWLTEWGITHVRYHGMLSPKAKQEAQDAFRNDPEIKVFLSTDAGQDSIDLPEASLTIHYDWPWTWSGVKQRENRQDRIDSKKDVVRVITLAVPETVEDRKAEIISRKQGYHNQVFSVDTSEVEELTKKDFMYILTGEA